MKTLLFLSSLLLFSFSLCAEDLPPSAKVVVLRGEAFLDGVVIKENQVIDRPGKITTGEKSFIKVFIEKWGNHLMIGPKSEMVLNFSDLKKYTLQSGSCRWISAAKKSLNEKPKGGIFTAQAAMGIRGTNFILMTNPLFGETEIVMFEGEVELKSLKDDEDKVSLKENQWGGIGGRFGQKISRVITLNSDQLKALDSLLKE